jgi:hypothetical protein
VHDIERLKSREKQGIANLVFCMPNFRSLNADMAMNDLETIFDCRGVIPTVKFISKALLNKAGSRVIKIQKSTYSF